MSRRFFVEPPLIDAPVVRLSVAEAQHAIRVLRVQVGETVTVFDGTGFEWESEVTEIGRNAVTLRILDRRAGARQPDRTVTLAVALPKGERQRWLIEKATELGVTRLLPLLTTRGVAQPSSHTRDKLRRHVIEACKQCGRNRLLEVGDPATVAEVVQDHLDLAVGSRLLAHPGGDRWADPPAGDPVVAMIGPEGGFTEAEVNLAVEGGWKPTSLGERLLRIETAALAIAARLS